MSTSAIARACRRSSSTTMEALSTPTPRPRTARSITASPAVACRAMFGVRPFAAQDLSKTVRMPHDVGENDLPAGGQRVPDRDDSDHALADDRQRGEAGRRSPRRPDQGEIRYAGTDTADQPIGVVLVQRHLDAGMNRVKRGERVEQRQDGAA